MGEEPPLTDQEIMEVRRILDEESKRLWLWSLMRRTAAWAFGTVAVLVAFGEDIQKIVGWIFTRGNN